MRRFSTNAWKLFPVVPGMRPVPKHIEYPPYARGVPIERKEFIEIRTAEEIEAMRKASRFASRIRAYGGSLCQPGITTEEIDRLLHEKVCSWGVYPSPVGYQGFPKACTTSVNEVLCHGIPDTRPLEDGDIINIDVSCYVDGFHGDCSGMFEVGTVDEVGKRLVKTTIDATRKAIGICGPGVELKQIGRTIHDIADEAGFGVCRAFCGHGIGRDFHIPPLVLHFRNDYPGTMLPGMVFTIEPILLESQEVEHTIMEDGWTAVSPGGHRAAQYEETILITSQGVEILTQHDENNE